MCKADDDCRARPTPSLSATADAVEGDAEATPLVLLARDVCATVDPAAVVGAFAIGRNAATGSAEVISSAAVATTNIVPHAGFMSTIASSREGLDWTVQLTSISADCRFLAPPV